jgi:DNA-binding MarR family transcriptional regulator
MAQNTSTGLNPRTVVECRECTCFNLRKAARAVTRLYDGEMRLSGLRATQYALLVHMYAMGPVVLTKLAQAMVTDRTTMARNIEPLQTGGLIKIEDGKDRRTRIVCITNAGREKLEEAYPMWKKAQDEILEIFGRDVWRSMTSRISSLVNRILKY